MGFNSGLKGLTPLPPPLLLFLLSMWFSPQKSRFPLPLQPNVPSNINTLFYEVGTIPELYLHISCGLILLFPWSTGLDPRLVFVRFVVEKVAMGQCYVRVLRIFLVRIIPLMLHTHLYPVTYLTARASGGNLRAFKQSEFFSDVEQRWTKEKGFHIVLFYFSDVRTLGFGGLEVACWPLVPKFASSNPAEAVGFLRAKKSSARLPSEGK